MTLSLIVSAIVGLSGPLAAQDSVAFVAFQAHASQTDCPSPDTGATLCRVRQRVDAKRLETLVSGGTRIVRDGEFLTFVHRSTSKGVDLTGGIQYPMSPVVGTELWVVTLHVPKLDEAVISYAFIDETLRVGERIKSEEWRGPKAPAAALKATKLAGVFRTDTVPSKHYKNGRVVFSYVPPERGNAPIAGVIYMGDGVASGIAPYVDTLITTGKLPRVMLVSVPPGEATSDDPPGTDVRAMEYLFGYEPNNARFFAHERFIVEDLIPWAENTLGAPSEREKRAVWGISNSGGWAISMGLRHSDVMGTVLAFSPGGSHGDIPPESNLTASVRFYLQGGIYEPAFNRIAHAWSDTLNSRGVPSTVREVTAGHDWLVWCERMSDAILWAWPMHTS